MEKVDLLPNGQWELKKSITAGHKTNLPGVTIHPIDNPKLKGSHEYAVHHADKDSPVGYIEIGHKGDVGGSLNYTGDHNHDTVTDHLYNKALEYHKKLKRPFEEA